MNTSKIIKGVVGGGRYTVTAPIIKEDYGLYLKIEGLELPSTYEVDFSNDEHSGTSVTMIGNSDGVLIPSQFIKSGKDVFAFLYHVGDNYGRTVFKFRIPNKLRPDRTDETPTPEQASTIDQAIAALNEAVEQTAQDVIDAEASAQDSAESAQDSASSALSASDSAERASASATSASQSADSASASASASAQSASQSAQIKSDVEGMVDDAQGYAQASAQSASASANSAIQASLSESEAERAKGNAQTYASQAQTSAQTASQKASESAQSATNAQTYASNAESAKTDAQTAKTQAETARDEAVTAKNDAESARDEAQSIVDGISGKVEQIDQNTADIASLEEDRYTPYVVDSASGSIASFPDGADNIPLKSLVVDINPVQDTSSGDPSPDNICPISGWEGCNLRHTGDGKNLLISDATGSGNYTITSTGGRTTDPSRLSSDYIPCVSGQTYVVSGIVGANTKSNVFSFAGIAFYDSDKIFISRTAINNVNTLTATAPSNAVFMRFFEEATKAASELGGTLTTAYYATYKRQIEAGSTATTYSPYNGTLIPISWQSEAGTVYGGKLDVLTGKLSVTEAIIDAGAGAITATIPTKGVFALALPNGLVAGGNGKVYDAICDTYKFTTTGYNDAHDDEDGVMWMYVKSRNARVKDSRFIGYSAAEAKAALSGVNIVYPLAEPIEIQLTPTEVRSLLGANNIWADTGDASVEYRADTKLYIEKLTQPEEDDMIADSAITEGQFFMVGNSLYRALANIASGATITVGTNAQRVSLSDALNLINA